MISWGWYQICVAGLTCLTLCAPPTGAQVSVALIDTQLQVQEGQQFGVRVRKTGTLTEEIVVVVAIVGEDTSDFIGNSQVGRFEVGGQDETSTLFTVRDDPLPELEERYTFTLQVVGGKATVLEPSTATVVILTSDDAYGRFGFAEGTVLQTSEGSTPQALGLVITRSQGLFGTVLLQYQVEGDSEAALPGEDITPVSGDIEFLEGQSEKLLTLEIQPDQIPEDLELFTVTLSSTNPEAAFSIAQRQIAVLANDAPIRFSQSNVLVEEGPGTQTITLVVTRGVQADGKSLIGPTDLPATVSYQLISGSAVFGEDFTGQNNDNIGFPVNSTEQTIVLQILDDDLPEVEETFEVQLRGANGDVVLADPSKVTVAIGRSDDPNGVLHLGQRGASQLPIGFVNEDQDQQLNISIYRSDGTIGDVSIQWEISRIGDTLGDLVTSDLSPSQGVFELLSGQTTGSVVLSVVQDTTPEPVEKFEFRLLNDTIMGGARLEVPVSMEVVITDSDFAYGVVGMAPDSQQRLITSTVPRVLELAIERTGGTLGDVNVTISIQYNESLDIMDVLGVTNPVSVSLLAGESQTTVNLTINPAAFLVVGANFTVQVMQAQLNSDPINGAYNSPVIGSRPIASVLVTAEAANGEIGFMNTQPITVEELDNVPNQVVLRISREGTNGRARIMWELTGVPSPNSSSVTASDLQETSGSVIMDSGMSLSEIAITVLPDDEPETDEVLMVTLTSVQPADTQRLRPGAATLQIVIKENDNPGGTFQFSPLMSDNYTAEEEGYPVDIVVERTGGALLSRSVEYFITPNGEAEFYGAANVLVFEPGVLVMNASVVARGDGIPELTESFYLNLRSYGSAVATLGPRTTVRVTVLPNDDPYGVIHFADNPAIVYTNESKEPDIQTVPIQLKRSGGTFESAVVDWTLEGDSVLNPDFSSKTGSVTFGPSQTLGFIILRSEPDDLPEPMESFTVRLSVPASGEKLPRLGEPSTAIVIIRENDHPVYFKGSTRVTAEEPSVVLLTVVRDGDPSFRAEVKYRTLDGTATHLGGDFIAVFIGTLTFEVGESEKSISIEILDDITPENDEEFTVELFDPVGDIVVSSLGNMTVVIAANDDASGVFEFTAPLIQQATEGSTATFDVVRERGDFGVVRVFWELSRNTSVPNVGETRDFVQLTGSVTFDNSVTRATISLLPLADNVPELSEFFILTLINVTGGVGGVFGRLGNPDLLTASLEILPNDDPNGLFIFRVDSVNVQVAEDFTAGNENSARAQIMVERLQGTYGEVSILWEIESPLSGSLQAWDLLFVGTLGNGVEPRPSERRPGSGTLPYFFNGGDDSVVTVPVTEQPHPSALGSGFTISIWLIPFSNTDSYIVFKTSPDRQTIFYGLKLTTAVFSTSLELRYSGEGKLNQVAVASSGGNIQNGNWHNIVVVVETSVASFYLDGELIANRTLETSVLLDDENGQLLVGASLASTDRYIGHLQDLQIIAKPLSASEVLERYEQSIDSDLSPLSGIVRFGEGVRQASLQINSVQDDIPEPEESLRVRLVGASGGGRIDLNHSLATVTVLKSDNANGLFGFGGDCDSVGTPPENMVFSCLVERRRGDSGQVTVSWVVVAEGQPLGTLLTGEFVNTTGTVDFEAGQTTQVLNLTVEDDLDPELAERYEVVLTGAVSGDGQPSSTPTSGASISENASRSLVVIPESDHPYGLLQFSSSTTPPSPTDPIIRPALVPPKVHTPEEAGSVSLLVVRAQGLEGRVTVEWRAEDGTATSSGSTPDYQAAGGRLDFNPGQRYGYITIQINDNNIPEDDKIFYVQLTNPTGGAAVAIGARVSVVIDYSDGAYGLFQFADNSRNISTPEVGDVGFSTVTLEVVRLGGTIGLTSVRWEVLGDTANDIISREGTLNFLNNQAANQFDLQVRADAEPELDHVVTVRLVNVSKGQLGDTDKLSASLVIEANDNPYGAFAIPSSNRPLQTTEGFKNVTISVQRLFGTRGIVDVDYQTLTPSETYAFISPGVARANYSDFTPVSGTIRFTAGQEQSSFSVVLLEDEEPEEAESVYVRLTAVRLVQGEQPRPVPSSPSLEIDSMTFAQILIQSNDNANGVVELSPLSVTVYENHTGAVVNVVRQGGLFGDIVVKYKITDGTTTKGQDYTGLSTDVILSEGEATKPLLVEIKDDDIPELAEFFTIELLAGMTGGAVLGSNTVATVTIAPSDDPSGAFSFTSAGLSVNEPTEPQGRQLSVTITRAGGTMGVVNVRWEATLNNVAASSEISPVAGNEIFVSNEAHMDITLTILPDDIPEEQEDIIIRLVEVSEGARIGSGNEFVLSILPSDNPHGLVSFSGPSFTVEERAADSTQYVTLTRRGGLFGAVRVFYQTQSIDLLTEVYSNGSSVFDFYAVAKLGESPGTTGTSVDVSGQERPLDSCAEACLVTEACAAFQFTMSSLSCVTFITSNTDSLQPSTQTQYYSKDMVKARFLYDLSSSPGDDYRPVTEAFVIIPALESVASIPVNILADNRPELDEKFRVVLTRIELVGRSPVNADDTPKFGPQTSAQVVIAANDNAQGVFSIYSANPSAEAGGSIIVVPERGQLSVDLVIDREGGSIGEVSISWLVNLTSSSASPGADFRADGAQLRFLDGDERTTIAVSILDDEIPEDDETVLVQLTQPGGGATISANHSVTVVIQANDNVAGILSISPLSVVTEEGKTVDLNITRSAPGLGQVTVDWEIQGIDGSIPNSNLNVYRGTLLFQQGELMKAVRVEVLRDQLPELNEEYELKLISVRTEGVRASGGARIHPQQGTASISIRGSDDPHGVISFSTNSLYVTVQEGETNLQLFVDRKFGSSGTVRVEFEASGGFLRQDGPGLELATPVEDFTPDGRYMYLEDGENSGVVILRIINDQVSEIDEAFLVNLTSVTLVGADTSLPPRLASSDVTAQVTITANDGAQGTLAFSPDSARVSVEEGNSTLTLEVLRSGGAFGNVSVRYFPQTQTNTVIPDRDFILNPQILYFSHGESSKVITVQVLEDDTPEPDEQLFVILDSPQGGALLGELTQASVTILANDDAGGFITFDLSDNITLTEPRGVNSADSVASFRLLRGPGIYGVVTVPFVVVTDRGEETTDLTPVRGYVTFQDRQLSAVLEISAVQDNLPEITEQFHVILQEPIGGAQLGVIQRRTILIRESDAPYGLLQIYATGTRTSFLDVEESAGRLHFDIVRSQGLQGNISVDVFTQSGSAAVSGNTSSFSMATVQTFTAQTTHRWYGFHFYDDTFAVMLTTTPGDVSSSAISGDVLAPAVGRSVLYEWREGFTPVQVFETYGATSAVSFVQGEITYLVVTNGGAEGRRETPSRVYRMSDEGELTVVQELSTVGAEDVTYFTSGGQLYLVVANGQSSSGLTVLDCLVYLWDSEQSQFSAVPWQLLGGRGAKAVEAFTIGSEVYLVMANHYDSETGQYEIESVVFKFHTNNKFAVYQYIPTQGAMDVKHAVIGGEQYLIIANGMLDESSAVSLSSVVYKWDRGGQSFQWHQNLDTQSAQSIEVFTGPDQKVYLLIADNVSNSTVFVWDTAQLKFLPVWQAGPTSHVSVVTVNHPVEPAVLLTLTNLVTNPGSALYQVTMVRDSDFIPRTSTLTFAPGETLKQTSVVVLEDDLPEDTETFYVALSNPQGGAEIGANQKASINILSNDDAHGIIEFAEDSLDKREAEIPQKDNPVQLTVRRYRGNHGRVVVRWRLTGDQSFQDITPQSGLVEFGSGQGVATISLVIKDDLLPELPELTHVTLETVVEPGTGLINKGAVLGTNRVARLTVLASDSPHGVVYWEASSVEVSEPEGTDATVLLNVIREQGTLGDIQISYRTTEAVQFDREEQAASGQDYVATQGRVVIRDGVSRGTISIQLLRDDLPELGEVFLVNLTGVALLSGTAGPGEGPSVRDPGNSVAVTILENDNARGLVLFDVITNTEGRVDTYEAYGRNQTLSLKVSRVIGYFGAVLVQWQVYHRETTITDVTPSSGAVRFAPGEMEAYIYLTILDDDLFEPMEQFDVKLIGTSEGASLGAISNVRVAIQKNDSPRGLFGFVTTEVSVEESRVSGDPNGRVSLTVTRRVGTEGVVPVQWRLNAEAQNDFDPPRSGLLTFQHGETQKTITLATKSDGLLEGEERFIVSLVSADDADISHDNGDATIIISPDPGSSGTVSILPAYRQVYVGEPGESSPNYRGQAEVVLSRGAGIFSGIAITWAITPRDITAFAQLEGTVEFATLQETATITVQARDDAQPELSALFSLQLTSATGGAVISSEQGAALSQIVFVASDYPHGLFQFSPPRETRVSEDEGYVTVSVVREYGNVGRVQVTFTTSAGTAAANQDFVPSSGTLTFEDGQRSQTVRVDVVQDSIPEGPENFYLNITSVQLILPSNNNYTDLGGGLSVDMKPDIGPVSYKTVVIDKNDNAEGTLLFDVSALQTTVREEDGMALLAVTRVGGNYGEVRVSYWAENLTATAGVDYTLTPGEVIFQDGMSQNSVNISIRDDLEREPAETFRVILTSTSGGAQLGASTTATVTIDKSDYPNGKFDFKGDIDIVLPNPTSEVTQEVIIQRSGGLLGQQRVSWRLLGPNNPGEILSDTSDIAYRVNSVDVTQGTLLWNDGEGGEKGITLYIKPHNGWEIQKAFVIEIYSITGSPSGVGNGETDPQRSKLSLTVQKHGDPNGVIQFGEVAQSPRMVDEPTGSTFTLRFPILRQIGTGVIGNIMVFWEVTGPVGDENDVLPMSGSVALENGVRTGEITLQILPDDVPELTENFQLRLVRVEGGAEISPTLNTSPFSVRYNDNPHGIFGVDTQHQTVLVHPVTNQRTLQLNITRNAGSFGGVQVYYSIRYDKPQLQSGIGVEQSSGSVTFQDGERSGIAQVKVIGDGFLEAGSTFSLSLVADPVYLGSEVTQPPTLQAGQTDAKVIVPESAANTQVGFSADVATVDEATSLVAVTVTRRGLYGTVQVRLQGGLPPGQESVGFEAGEITPDVTTVTMPQGEQSKTINFQVVGKRGVKEIFALHLPQAPTTAAVGGARLWAGKTVLLIEPSGVIGFAPGSREKTGSELAGEVNLTVERLYGSQDRVEAQLEVRGGNASSTADFRLSRSTVVMETGQLTAQVSIELLQDSFPETAEDFYLYLTQVEKYPTVITEELSPRISTLHNSSHVVIKESNDPYGILSFDEIPTALEESDQDVTVTVRRSGGYFGAVSVVVRTVGGNERWSSDIATQEGSGDPNTIGEALGNRVAAPAVGGRDYDIVDTVLYFADGEAVKTVVLPVLDDNEAEPMEAIYLYLTQPQGGARVATGSPDGGLKGFLAVKIEANDYSNGLIGFTDGSLSLTVDEDVPSPVIPLQLQRLNAFYGDVQVFWKVKVSRTSSPGEDESLVQQVTQTSGAVTCPGQTEICPLNIPLLDDQVPEEASQFVVILERVGTDAVLDTDRSLADITVRPSDDVRGRLQFVSDFGLIHVDKDTKSVRLEVARRMGTRYHVEVEYATIQLPDPIQVSGVDVYPALPNEDYLPVSGRLVFPPNSQELQYINLTLTPLQSRSNQYPKQLYLRLSNPTNGSRLHESLYQAVVRIVDKTELPIWSALKITITQPLDNENMVQLLDHLDRTVSEQMGENEGSLVEAILSDITNKGLETKFPDASLKPGLFDVFCKLLDPRKKDSRRGHYSYSKLLENFAYGMVTGQPCPYPTPPDLVSYQCQNVKISAGSWGQSNLTGFPYKAQYGDNFVVPASITGMSAHVNQLGCYHFHVIEYNSEEWFYEDGQTQPQLLNSRIVSFGIKGRDSSFSEVPATFRIHTPNRAIAPRRSQCVYFDESSKTWTGAGDVCTVTNNFALDVDDFVDCSCQHLTSYAVKARVSSTTGYLVWFYISCFICIIGLALTILNHHIFTILPSFSVCLLMHMCFACMATQICYVIAAYFSPTDILVSSLDEGNGRCIAMGLFLHYFFLAQFTWIMTQCVNFWKILVMNDEHTDRKYAAFFLLGWATPAVIVAVFYIIAYNVYKYVYNMPYDFIYGDVGNTGEICFITNALAGLGGVILPSILVLLVVCVVFVQAYQLTPQWKAYDDLYKGRHNAKEVRILLGFWAIILLTWLWGGLHLAYRHLWMLILFCIFNITQGLYALIVYTILRNPCLPCTRPQKTSYSVGGGAAEGATHPYHSQPVSQAPSIKGSRASLLNESWERNSISPSAQMKVRRTLPSNGNIYVTPPVLLHQPRDPDIHDFDDLLFALKTGGPYTASEISKNPDYDTTSEISSQPGNYEMRRISIADTHL